MSAPKVIETKTLPPERAARIFSAWVVEFPDGSVFGCGSEDGARSVAARWVREHPGGPPRPAKREDRFEPNLGEMGAIPAIESIAISLKRIADALTQCDKYGQTGAAAISQAIADGMRDGRP